MSLITQKLEFSMANEVPQFSHSSASPFVPHQLQLQGLEIGHGPWQLCQGWNHGWAPGLHLLQGGGGAGKSSLLRVLAGAQPPQAGTVRLAGQALGERDCFWVDPRQPGLQPEQMVRDWVGAQQAFWPQWQAATWQTHVQHWQLETALDKPWLALSTGTARKLWMAAGLASGAAVVLIDEPIAGLDRPSTAYLRQALAQQAGAQNRWVMVAHYDDLQGLPWNSLLELESLPLSR
jgi:ABC-type transport system involved in cytochrome c biogenesis ATPase subunit